MAERKSRSRTKAESKQASDGPTTSSRSSKADHKGQRVDLAVQKEHTIQPDNKPHVEKDKMSDDMPTVIEFDEDIGEAEAPSPLPVGDYRAQIREVQQRESQKGTRYAAVAFFISPDEYPADYTDGNPDGTVLMYFRTSLENNPQAKYRLRKFLEAVKAPMGKSIDLNDWVGLEATVSIVHEEYEGENRAAIKKVSEA